MRCGLDACSVTTTYTFQLRPGQAWNEDERSGTLQEKLSGTCEDLVFRGSVVSRTLLNWRFLSVDGKGGITAAFA